VRVAFDEANICGKHKPGIGIQRTQRGAFHQTSRSIRQQILEALDTLQKAATFYRRLARV
jgi:hypothetical protein